MDITKEVALELWDSKYGNKSRVMDYSGRWIDKYEYENEYSEFGWKFNHIRPLSQGGSSEKENLKISNIITDTEKAQSFPHWVTNSKRFKAYRVNENSYKVLEY